jgi:hypothetical protein
MSKLQTEASALGIHNLKLIWGDLDIKNSSTLPSDSIDRVIIANTLFQLEERDNLLEEIPNKIGSIFSDHAIGNDLLIFLLTAKKYRYFGYIAEPLAKFRSHAGSITISARGVRIPLHYNIVKAYFVENSYKPDINKMACYLQIFVMKSRSLKAYGVHSVSDFYFEKYKINYILLIKLLASKLIQKILKR